MRSYMYIGEIYFISRAFKSREILINPNKTIVKKIEFFFTIIELNTMIFGATLSIADYPYAKMNVPRFIDAVAENYEEIFNLLQKQDLSVDPSELSVIEQRLKTLIGNNAFLKEAIAELSAFLDAHGG